MRIFILFFCVICFSSCVLGKKEVIRKSTIKLEGEKTNIRDLIDIDGYYTSDPANMKHGGYIFFEDGSWVYFFPKRGLTQSDIQTNLNKSIEKEKSGKWGIWWGVYTIVNDTIIIHNYDEPVRLARIGLSERRYKVINCQTIDYYYYKIRTADEEYDKGLVSPWLDAPVRLHFIPADSLPSSDNWLKKNKWIWHNESDWEEYMKRIKLAKNQQK